jgi:hypothetical protein
MFPKCVDQKEAVVPFTTSDIREIQAKLSFESWPSRSFKMDGAVLGDGYNYMSWFTRDFDLYVKVIRSNFQPQ